MKNQEDYRKYALKQVCCIVATHYPEAVGVVFWQLDCGCIRVCGVSDKGEPVGKTILVAGQPMPDKDTVIVCPKCIENRGATTDRIVSQGLIWAEGKNGIPTTDVRRLIFREVFGSKSDSVGELEKL